MRRAAFVAVVVGAFWLAPNALAGGWCGSGQQSADRPPVVAGRQIHSVIVEPSDGAADFQTAAGLLSDDVASFSAWWVGQDPTRVPRMDLATFSGQTCLDISYLRMPQPAVSITSASALFDMIASDLNAAGFFDLYSKDLVYYIGPSAEEDVCGVGGGNFSNGPGIAVVIPTGCPGVPTDTVAAHELLHSLGALPAGAPHPCAGDSGHPCDSPTDILYPFTRGEPISQKVLDFGHDDYYGHSGSWNDLQDSGWLRHLDQPQQALTVTPTGSGTVTSDVPGVECTAACTTQWDLGSTVNLSAEAGANSRFIGWGGDCIGAGSCLLTLDAPKSVTVKFGPLNVPVVAHVKGKGHVVCTPACSKSFSAGLTVTMRAVPAKSWKFARWSGSCKGTKPVCRPPTDFGAAATATFVRAKK